MNNSSNNTTSSRGGEDEKNRQSIHGSLSMDQSANLDQFIQNLLSGSSVNQNSEQNRPGINQWAAEAEPKITPRHRQPSDIPAGSGSKRNIPENTAVDHQLARKRAYDRAYRERVKGNQKRIKSVLEITEVENGRLEHEIESLKMEKGLVNEKFQTQSMELDELRNNFNDLKRRFKRQLENAQQMESTLKTLEDGNKSLKEENASVNQKYEIQLKELDKLKKRHEKQHENKQLIKSNIKTLEAENESLKEEKVLENQRVEKRLGRLEKKYEKQLRKRKGMKTDLKTLEAEIEFLKGENVWVKQRFETQSRELDELKYKFDGLDQKLVKQLKMESNMEALEVENESLKEKNILVNQKFEAQSKELYEVRNNFEKLKQGFIKKCQREEGKTLVVENEEDALMCRSFETENQSRELSQLKSKLEKLEKEFASALQSKSGSSTNFIECFGQDPIVGTEGFKQSCQATALLSPLAFSPRANGPAMPMGLPSPSSVHSTFHQNNPNELMTDSFRNWL